MNKPKSVKLETPIGSIESDSGNHLTDICTILIVIVFFYILKKVISRYVY